MKRLFKIVAWMTVTAFLIVAIAPARVEVEASAAEEQTQTESTALHATVGEEAAHYYVQIPETIAFGELSKDTANELKYTIAFQATDLRGGKVEISAEQTGNLIDQSSGNKFKIPFENRLGVISFTESKDVTGSLYVKKEAVASAHQGNYKGKMNFTIQYKKDDTTTKPDNNQNEGNQGEGSQGEGNQDHNGSSDNNLLNNTYIAKMSLRKSTDINETSMCDSLFFGYADLVVEGPNTKMTFYVIDPIPQYPSEGTPLSDIWLEANGTKYFANADSQNKVMRYYHAANGFIPRSGTYTSDVVTVTVPTSAVERSSSGALKCNAYVNVVMKSMQTFYIVLSDFESGTTSEHLIPSDALSLMSTPGGGSSRDKAGKTDSLDVSQLKDGIYSIPIRAIKEASEEASMMSDYMYPYAKLEVAGKKLALTIHIQRQVAGIDGGGPEYISYDGTKATKTTGHFSDNGIDYESFTFNLNDQLVTPMTVTMFVKAMSMEVKARLVLDLSSIKEGASNEVVSGNSGKGDTKHRTKKSENQGQRWLTAQSVGIKIILGLIAVLLSGMIGYAGLLRYRRNR